MAYETVQRSNRRRCTGAAALLIGVVLAVIADPGASATVNIPSIVTAASPDITLGDGVLTDTAVVLGRVDPQPGATIDFALYGPDDATCAGPPLFESIRVPYPADDGPVTSEGFSPGDAGTYRWRATYSGDANNLPVSGACNDPNETVVVSEPVSEAPGAPSVLSLLSPFPIVRIVGRTTPRGVKISRMTVRAQVGAQIVSRCAGPAARCPYRERVTNISGPPGQVRTVRVPGFVRIFRAGIVLRVFVVEDGRTGKFTSFRVRIGRAPARIDTCVSGLALSPIACPAS